MWPAASSRPLRVALAILLLLAPAWIGCFGPDEEPRLAKPTSSPIVVPSRAAPRTPTVSWDFSDPGYRVTGAWRAGDGWDYESNQSHYRYVRVIDTRLMNGTTYYVVEERLGTVDQPAQRVVRAWVDGRAWALVNSTDDTNGVDRYQPGQLLRFFKNGSFAYNHTRVEGSGRRSADEAVTVQSRLYAQHQTLLFPWGYVEAKRVEQTTFARESGGNRSQTLATHWVHKDYLNELQYQLASGEQFKLTAVKAGDFRRGTLQT